MIFQPINILYFFIGFMIGDIVCSLISREPTYTGQIIVDIIDFFQKRKK